MWGPFPTSHSKQWKSRHWKLLRPSGEGPDKFKLKFTVKRHFPLHIISSPAIILQCNANDSFALAIKLLRHDPVSIWLRTRMNNIFQCVLCCGFRSRNLATEIAGNCTHACVISVDLPYFWPTSPNAEQGVKYFALFFANITECWTRFNKVENIWLQCPALAAKLYVCDCIL